MKPVSILTQKDVREVQLAKAAIRAGIELLTEKMVSSVSDIQKAYLVDAFGNYLNPASACRIGMIPSVLAERIVPIGNVACEGAKLCALNTAQFEYSKCLATETDFLELPSMPQFQDCYIDALEVSEEALPYYYGACQIAFTSCFLIRAYLKTPTTYRNYKNPKCGRIKEKSMEAIIWQRDDMNRPMPNGSKSRI